MKKRFYVVIEACPRQGPLSIERGRARRRTNIKVWLQDEDGRQPQVGLEADFNEMHPSTPPSIARGLFYESISEIVVKVLKGQLDAVLPLAPEPRQEQPTLPESDEQESR